MQRKKEVGNMAFAFNLDRRNYGIIGVYLPWSVASDFSSSVLSFYIQSFT